MKADNSRSLNRLTGIVPRIRHAPRLDHIIAGAYVLDGACESGGPAMSGTTATRAVP